MLPMPEKQQQQQAPVWGWGSIRVPCCSTWLPKQIQTLNWLHAALSYITRHVMSTDACSTLHTSWPSYKFQNLQPSSVFMPWAERAPCHETIHKGAVKDSDNLIFIKYSYSSSFFIKPPASGQSRKGSEQSQYRDYFSANSTKLNLNLNALRCATSPYEIIIYFSRHSPSKSMTVQKAQWKCCLSKPVTRLSGANHGICDLKNLWFLAY